MGGKSENDRVASPECVPIHLKMYGYIFMFVNLFKGHLFYFPCFPWVFSLKKFQMGSTHKGTKLQLKVKVSGLLASVVVGIACIQCHGNST